VQLEQHFSAQPFAIRDDDMHRWMPDRLLEGLEDGQQPLAQVDVAVVGFTIQDMPTPSVQVELFQTGMHFMARTDEPFGHRLLGPQQFLMDVQIEHMAVGNLSIGIPALPILAG